MDNPYGQPMLYNRPQARHARLGASLATFNPLLFLSEACSQADSRDCHLDSNRIFRIRRSCSQSLTIAICRIRSRISYLHRRSRPVSRPGNCPIPNSLTGQPEDMHSAGLSTSYRFPTAHADPQPTLSACHRFTYSGDACELQQLTRCAPVT